MVVIGSREWLPDGTAGPPTSGAGGRVPSTARMDEPELPEPG